MKVNLIGGSDVQRSLNHSDNRCINLVPSLNDKGDIAAYYKVDGLKSEGTFTGVPTGAYKASNGRAFYTSGTVLYELTIVAGVYTSTARGTITTATTYRMSDNGIEMIMVNGTDGWLFTFSTNALLKIKVATDTFTVTIANPAVFTQSAHGLVAGDAIRLTTTTGSILSDSMLAALSPATNAASASYIAVAPAGGYVYSGSDAPIINQRLRNQSNGDLSNLSPASVVLYGNNLVLSHNGTSAYGTNVSNQLLTYSVSLVNGQISASGFAAKTISTAMAQIYVSANDGFVYCLDYANGRIYQFTRAGTGELTAMSPAYIATGAYPLEMCISSDGLFVYVTNGRFFSTTANTISVHARNNTSGLITEAVVESKPCGGIYPNGIAISNDDAHIYVVNSGSNSIAMFSRNVSTGVLTALSTATVDTETYPTKLVISADDVSVYAINQSSNSVSMFSRDSSTGILTVLSTPSLPTGTGPLDIAISSDDENIYIQNGNSTISMYSRNATATTVGLPTGLAELTTYYVIAAGLTADAFTVSETAGGTAVSTSGQQAGVHTYTTLGYGFPEGAKTVSYMNGRFVALEPNTQNFFVSEVLNGAWWDALNVQTVDSNPDYVIGEIVSHNELIVFCDDSGEVFYDSGVTPSPFVRNSSGIFEVGCIAPYSICVLDNQVFWLGGNKTGKGIIYKLQGYTPVRISTHSIEYAIQGMSTTSDARAFAYQKDGHHYYVLTFPTGNKTFVYDVNTGIWHERAKTTPDAIVPSMSFTPSTSAITDIYVYDIEWNGTVFCAVGMTHTTNAATTRCYTSTDGITWTPRTMSVSSKWDCIAWNGTVFCATGSNLAFSTIAATSPDGITWTTSTMPSNSAWSDIAYGGGVFVAVAINSSVAATSPDGITWTSRTLPTSSGWISVAWNGTVFCAVAADGTAAATSTDGITWTARTLPSSAFWGRIAWNGSLFMAIVGDTHGFIVSSTVAATSPDGITWTARTLPASVLWSDIDVIGDYFLIVNRTNNNTYLTTDGITYTQIIISGSSGGWFSVSNNGTNFAVIGNASPALSAISSAITIPATTYTLTEWPVNEHIYFNDKHIVTDTTTSVLSIDSATYKNGSEVMQYIRSFNVPTQNMNKTRHTRLQLDCEAGVGATTPEITLKWADDGAHTFNTGLTASLGTTGEYSKRVVWHRLGMTKGQQRVYELSGVSDTKVVLLNVHLD